MVILRFSQLEDDKRNCDPRQGKKLLSKHTETERAIEKHEKLKDEVVKEGNAMLKAAKLPSDKPVLEKELKSVQQNWTHLQTTSWNYSRQRWLFCEISHPTKKKIRIPMEFFS